MREVRTKVRVVQRGGTRQNGSREEDKGNDDWKAHRHQGRGGGSLVYMCNGNNKKVSDLSAGGHTSVISMTF